MVAPSKLQRPPGDKVKTDRRDAERLARLPRIGELPGVRVPSEAEESARDLVRAREDARGDLMRARHRLSKLLLRQGLVWDNSAWTGAHEAWLRSLRFDRVGVRVAFDEAFEAVLSVHARRDRLDAAIVEMVATSAFAPVVGRLCCLRGIGVLTAFGLAVEVGDWNRFTGSTIGSYLGLVPSEFSSGRFAVVPYRPTDFAGPALPALLTRTSIGSSCSVPCAIMAVTSSRPVPVSSGSARLVGPETPILEQPPGFGPVQPDFTSSARS